MRGNAQATSAIDRAFFDALSPHGFSRLPGEQLSYLRDSPDGKARSHIDVEIRDYLGGFGVTLQDVKREATRRQRLEDFRGLRAYAFSGDASDAIAQALADLALYGLPWLDGQAVATVSGDRIDRAVKDRAYDDAIREARERFKQGAYEEALRLFERAEASKPLTPTDEKFRSLAQRRTSPGLS